MTGPPATHVLTAAPGGRHWIALSTAGRLAATGFAALLVLWEGPHPRDAVFIGYAIAGTAALAGSRTLRSSRAVWAADGLITLSFVLASGDWRSPYYLLWLASLTTPAVALPLRGALVLALGAPVAYFAVAVAGGPAPGRLGPVTSETLAIHLALPLLLIAALAYAAHTFRHLQRERRNRQRLELEAERRRIAWELHDSAKQRLHAAHLLLSSIQDEAPRTISPRLDAAVVELESAATDMDTSLAELRSPLEGRPLEEAVAARAAQLADAGGVRLTVTGRAPGLPTLCNTQLYRIAAEAVTNAVRHADASRVDVSLETDDGTFTMCVADDGRGVGATARDGANGMDSMRSRAASIGATLAVGAGHDGRGTEVRLTLPTPHDRSSP